MTKEIFTKVLLEEFKARGMTLTEISSEIYGHPENYRNIRRAYKRHGIEPFRNNVLKPTKEELEAMVVGRGMSPYEIAKELGYGKDGWSNIYSYCREYNITEFDFSPNAHVKKREIDGEIASIVHGTLLGDGSLTYKGSLTVAHGEKQLDYLQWKQRKLDWLCFGSVSKKQAAEGGVYSQLPTYTIRTHVHPYLKILRRDSWVDGVKRVSPFISSPVFDELALAVWYFDDGSLNKHSGVVTIATNGFCLEDVVLLREFLMDRFGIESKLEPRRKDTHSLRVNKSKTSKFFELITSRIKDIPPSMEHKIPCQ